MPVQRRGLDDFRFALGASPSCAKCGSPWRFLARSHARSTSCSWTLCQNIHVLSAVHRMYKLRQRARILWQGTRQWTQGQCSVHRRRFVVMGHRRLASFFVHVQEPLASPRREARADLGRRAHEMHEMIGAALYRFQQLQKRPQRRVRLSEPQALRIYPPYHLVRVLAPLMVAQYAGRRAQLDLLRLAFAHGSVEARRPIPMTARGYYSTGDVWGARCATMTVQRVDSGALGGTMHKSAVINVMQPMGSMSLSPCTSPH